MSARSGPGAVRATFAYLAGVTGATYADRVRLAAFTAARPDAHVYRGEFGEWFCDFPDSRTHAGTLGRLLDRLAEPDG